MDEKKIYKGFGVIVAVLLIGAVLSNGSGKDSEADDQIARSLAPVQNAIAALDERVTTMAASVDALTSQVGQGVSQEDLADIQAQLDGLTEQSTELGARTDTSEKVTEAPVPAAEPEVVVAAAEPAAEVEPIEAVAVTAEPTAQAPATETAPTEETGASDGSGLKPGQTALFADGAVRVFVSRLEPEAGKAHVMAAGRMLTLLQDVGRTISVDDAVCRVSMSGVSEGGAVMDATCGDDLGEPEGLSAGQSALFEDGVLRVFVSRVTEDSARIFVNGEGAEVSAGSDISAMVEDRECDVTLDQVDRGFAQVSATCS